MVDCSKEIDLMFRTISLPTLIVILLRVYSLVFFAYELILICVLPYLAAVRRGTQSLDQRVQGLSHVSHGV